MSYMEAKKISKAVVLRLPRYYRYLGELQEEGCERISSRELSQRMKVTASQIRQDLIDKKNNAIIIGAGNLGQAIANYSAFERRGFVFKAMFDVNPLLFGKTFRNVPVYSLSHLEEFVKNNDIKIAALAIPKTSAPDIADKLVKFGVKAFWNFAHLDLRVPKGIAVENVHLSESLMRLSYKLSNLDSFDDDEDFE